MAAAVSATGVFASLNRAAVARLVARTLPDVHAAEGEAALELASRPTSPARLVSATVIEGHELRARRVHGDPTVGFAAFLDGTQRSEVVGYGAGGIPIVLGTVGAVIRDRRNRRLYTWEHEVRRRLYVPRARMSVADWDRLSALDARLADTSETETSAGSEHPLALREAAVQQVQTDRERLEQTLAATWCARESRPILIDGGISGTEPVARASCAIGVVKSHRTLYVLGQALETVLRLAPGERSSVFVISSSKRANVASWYLRLRDWRGHDPMWGLVRVEIAAPVDGAGDVGARADDVSRWVLAEAVPVSLPDSRWDTMVYGVRDCEEFLKAVM